MKNVFGIIAVTIAITVLPIVVVYLMGSFINMEWYDLLGDTNGALISRVVICVWYAVIFLGLLTA